LISRRVIGERSGVDRVRSESGGKGAPICKIIVKNTGVPHFMSGFGSNITFKIIAFGSFYPEILTVAGLILVLSCWRRRAGFWTAAHPYPAATHFHPWDRI
jgi:hypothetical protein